ncbi:MAG: D-alanyl-D-alanine carboxypeptidase/D-alanyl-D-alanine-endopeptidase [Bacteroidetes bacterium]|nr:D-alanyl-D-alanine carboxypeptidase/D-alanyl-D-alanine-endopeptidase [bacterium]NBP64268.1 D-alanyl-D-alanine carboxypeptidase/D-alanyl-D-alanine-endopeptidase [Bacteroidota bacterium]
MNSLIVFLCFALFSTHISAIGHATIADSVKHDKKSANGQVQSFKQLQEDIDAILSATELVNASVGISVLFPGTGETLYKRNDQTSLIPASTMKMFTTAAALELLGPDFKYTTRFYIDGTIQNSGELDGDLIIRASGDPSMSAYFLKDPGIILDNIALKLDSLGITSIKGNIILDHSYFDDEEFGPGWAIDDIPYPYSAPISAIAFHDNKVELQFKPGAKAGDYSRMTMIPENSYLRIVNNVMTVPMGNATLIDSDADPRSGVIDMQGSIAMAPPTSKDNTDESMSTIGLSIHDPVQFFLQLCKQRLEKMGIRIRGSLLRNEMLNENINYVDLKELFAYDSPSLSSIITVINTVSHNLGAEMLFKTMAKEQFGEGSFAKGADYMKRFISKIGIIPEQCAIVDGSGLSRLNLLSAYQQTQLLIAMDKSPNREYFRSSLARPGQIGTLKNRMLQSLAQQQVIAKTGSMNNVSCLSGYATTRDGEQLVFSMMMNGFTAPDGIIRNLQDMICMRLASFSRK